jgi:hypothetical protein
MELAAMTIEGADAGIISLAFQAFFSSLLALLLDRGSPVVEAPLLEPLITWNNELLEAGSPVVRRTLRMVLQTPAEMKQNTSGTRIVKPIHPADRDRT